MGDGFNRTFTGASIALTNIYIREALLPTAMYADSLYNHLRNNTVFYKGPNYFATKNDWFGTTRFAGIGTHVNANILPNQKEICLEKSQNAFGTVWENLMLVI